MFVFAPNGSALCSCPSNSDSNHLSVHVWARFDWKTQIDISECILQMAIAFLWIETFMVASRHRMSCVKILFSPLKYYRTVIKIRFNFEVGNEPFWIAIARRYTLFTRDINRVSSCIIYCLYSSSFFVQENHLCNC